jgi:hypothetical protein
MALINTVLVACAHIQPGRSLALLRQTEEEYRTGERWFRETSRRPRPVTGDEPKGRRKK